MEKKEHLKCAPRLVGVRTYVSTEVLDRPSIKMVLDILANIEQIWWMTSSFGSPQYGDSMS
jgi:hypothetical protein